MPPVATNAPPSTLPDVLRQIVDVFSAVGDATPVQIGKQYLDDFGAGLPPKVLLVPFAKGEAGPPIEMGNAFSLKTGCNLLIRGAEDGSDLGRYDTAVAMLARIGDYLGTACTGRIEWGAFQDDSPAAIDCYGADLAVSFAYKHDVVHNAARRRLASAVADVSPPRSAVHPEALPSAEPVGFTVTTQPTT